MVQPALFETRLLDDFPRARAAAATWYAGKDHGGTALLHAYLMYRVQNETRPHQRRFLDIRKVAERVCEESTTQDLVSTMETLCWLALPAAMDPSTNTKLENEPLGSGLSSGLDLLCAAAYLNVIPLAKKLLQEGHCPTSESHLFPSPMQLAAWAGNANLMELFQESLPEYDEKGLRESLIGAAISGDIKLARLAAYPPSWNTPITDVAAEKFGKLPFVRGVRLMLVAALSATRDPEVDQYFSSLVTKPHGFLATQARNHAFLGNVEMLRYLLDAGADIQGCTGDWGNPLCVSHCSLCSFTHVPSFFRPHCN